MALLSQGSDGNIQLQKSMVLQLTASRHLMSAEWWKAAGIRAAKTMFQTGAALVVTQMPGGSVDWMAVGSAVIVAGVASLGTSLAGLPELEKGDKA